MPTALSEDLRWRIIWMHCYKRIDCKKVAEMLSIHVSTVYRVIDRYHEGGTVAPVPHRSGPVRTLGSLEEFFIIETLMARPEIYLDELQRELYSNTGTWASLSTIFRTIHRLGFTRKKLQRVALRRNDFLRDEFMKEMKYVDAGMIVWLDETGSDKRSESRKFGYHLRGMTPRVYKLNIRGKRISSIAIMSTRGIEDVAIYEGNINGETFSNFIDQNLVPILQPFNGTNSRSIVVMDNASIHHVERVATSILGTGALLRYLPLYSPDFNPLEEAFAKVKSFLKSNEIAYEVTNSAHFLVLMAYNTITTEDSIGYIRHAGYNM